MGPAGRRSRDATRRYTSGSPSEGTARTRRRRVGRSSSRSRNTARWWPRSPPTSASPTTSRFSSSLGCVLALAGGVAGVRPAPGQRLAATEVGAGAVRLAASAQFLLEPGARKGASLYGGFGIAFAGATSQHGAGYLTALVGLESAPGRTAGWYAELGFAGGVRLAAGRRWRRLPSSWQ